MLVRAETFRWAQATGSAPAILGTPAIYDEASADPLNLAYQLPSAAADRLVVAIFDDNTRTVTSITWTATGAAGQSLTFRRRESNGTSPQTSVELWDRVSPNFGTSSGNGTLSVDRDGASVMGAIVYALDGAHTDAPVVNGQNAANTNNPAALAIDPEPNSIIFDFVAVGTADHTITFDGAESEDLDANFGVTVARMAAAHKSVVSGDATTVDVSISNVTSRFAQIAASYKTS